MPGLLLPVQTLTQQQLHVGLIRQPLAFGHTPRAIEVIRRNAQHDLLRWRLRNAARALRDGDTDALAAYTQRAFPPGLLKKPHELILILFEPERLCGLRSSTRQSLLRHRSLLPSVGAKARAIFGWLETRSRLESSGASKSTPQSAAALWQWRLTRHVSLHRPAPRSPTAATHQKQPLPLQLA